MEHIYGARFGPKFEELFELNNADVSKRNRLTIFNDAFTKSQGDYVGKKNFRFVVGSTQDATTQDGRIYLYHPFSGNSAFINDLLGALGPDLDWEGLNIVWHAAIAGVVFDARDRSLYLFRIDRAKGNERYYRSTLYVDQKGNFSSVEFEGSIELPKNIIYKLNYFTRELIQVTRLED